MGALFAGAACAAPVDCEVLRDPLPEPRWLSQPGSRLVVNPFLGRSLGHNGLDSDTDGALPMRLAYYVGAAPVQLPAFWFLLPADSSPGYLAGPRLSLSDASLWLTADAHATFGGESVRVTSDGDFGAIRRTVTVDLDKTPDLLVQTPPGSPVFDMKVNGGDQPVDTTLHPTQRLGAATADIPAATGWHGIKTFRVLLYVFQSHPVTFTRIQFFRLPALQISHEESDWMPHEILSQAEIGAAG